MSGGLSEKRDGERVGERLSMGGLGSGTPSIMRAPPDSACFHHTFLATLRAFPPPLQPRAAPDRRSEACPTSGLDLLAQQCLWHSVGLGKPLLLRAEQQGEVFLLVSGRGGGRPIRPMAGEVTFRDARGRPSTSATSPPSTAARARPMVTLEPAWSPASTAPAFIGLCLRDEPLVAERVMQRLAPSLVRQLCERVIELKNSLACRQMKRACCDFGTEAH